MLMLQSEDIQEGLRETLDTTQSSPPIHHFADITVDNPDIIHRVQEFHRTLATLQNVSCNVCLEQFPCFMTNTTATEICRRCDLDTQIPKMFSAENNMNPGPVPPELSVHYINVVKIFLLHDVRIKSSVLTCTTALPQVHLLLLLIGVDIGEICEI